MLDVQAQLFPAEIHFNNLGHDAVSPLTTQPPAPRPLGWAGQDGFVEPQAWRSQVHVRKSTDVETKHHHLLPLQLYIDYWVPKYRLGPFFLSIDSILFSILTTDASGRLWPFSLYL